MMYQSKERLEKQAGNNSKTNDWMGEVQLNQIGQLYDRA